MKKEFERTASLLGENAIKKLQQSSVAVFGIGGVGGYVVEALARSGIGFIDLFDNDTVSLSNINRQIIATQKTIGKLKVNVAKERILDINPDCIVNCYNVFFTAENSSDFDFSKYDYIVDAIDTVSSKIELVKKSQDENVPIISSMGTGNKICPNKFEVADIYKTSVCPLARVMRYELKKQGVKKLKVVYSKELPVVKLQTPASCSFVPSSAGLLIASEVIKDLIKGE